MLNSLFPAQPNAGTLACLIHQAVNKFGNEICLATGNNKATYCRLDCWSDDLAAYLRGNGYQKSNVLFVEPDGSAASVIVLIAGVKAGMILIESNDISAASAAKELLKKNILTFAHGFFEEKLKKISFLKALEIGKGYLFFNIPDIYEDDIVFVSLTSDPINQRMVSHKAALEIITNCLPKQDSIPFIDFFYCLKNNFMKGGKHLLKPDPLISLSQD